MTIKKWIGAFTDTNTKSSHIFAWGFGRQLRALGSDVALLSPHSLFMANEWISASYFSPQTHVHVWLGAVTAFSPLWLHHDCLLEEVIQEMHTSDEEAGKAPVDSMSESLDEVSVASAATAPAPGCPCRERTASGTETLWHLSKAATNFGMTFDSSWSCPHRRPTRR